MGAYEELRATGTLGDEGAQLLYRTVAARVRLDRVPPPTGASRWDADALRELAHDFLTDERGVQRLTSLYLRSSDNDSLARLLQAAVRNWLRDRARRSDVGPLRRRMSDVLGDMEDAEQHRTPSGPHWSLQPYSDQPAWTGSTGPLKSAAWSAPGVQILRWRSTSRRDPVADRLSWERFFRAVLEAAQAPVLLSTLVEVAVDRFGLAATPVVVELDAEPGLRRKSGKPSAERVALVDIRARQVWDELSPRERLLVGVYGESVRQVAGVVGLGKSAAAVAIRQFEERLRILLEGDRDADRIWALLETFSAERRTAQGSASL